MAVGGTNLVNQTLAYVLALEIQAYRIYQSEQRLVNYADGFDYITGDQGRIIAFGFMTGSRPQVGYGNSGIAHSEQQLFLIFRNKILPSLARCGNLQPNYTLHTVLFTQKEPCYQCQPALRQIRQQLANSLPSGMKLDFTVWTSADQNLPDVLKPGTVRFLNDVVQVNI